MADLSQTATSVVPSSGADLELKTAGATITAGACVYLDSSAGTIKLADNNDTAAIASAYGIAVTGAASGQQIVIAKGRSIVNIGATLTVGEIYCVSANAGAICPVADVGVGKYLTILGYASTAALLQMNIVATGVAHG